MRTAKTVRGKPSSQRTGAEQAADATLEELPFPRYQIALVQDESEMLLQPAYDLFAFLSDDADQRWDTELYTERTFEALLHAERQFDCIVIGLNAAWKSKIVRETLSAQPPQTGLCVLHQREHGALPFLTDDVGVDIVEFDEPIDRVVVAEKLDVADEILLNWPAGIALQPPVETDAGGSPAQLADAEVYCGLARSPTSRWRTILEVQDAQRRVPVLLRTRSGRHPPVVVCTVLLQPRHEEHGALLGNILMWCVSGRPEALVVGDPESMDEARLVHRKLRMQGAKAVSTRIDHGSGLDFTTWPYRGIRDIVVPAAVDPTAAEDWPASDPAHVQDWLRNGGRILRLGPGEQVTVTHGESDAHWVTRRWAAWFLSEPAAYWHGGIAHGRSYSGSLIGTRAVLRFLAALHDGASSDRPSQPGSVAMRHVFETLEGEGSGIEPRTFGLQPPTAFLKQVARLLRSRHPASSAPIQHVDYSVSTTCSVLDINSLTGGEALDTKTVAALASWLRDSQFELVGLEERLEIARCLADEELLVRALRLLEQRLASRQPLTAALETKLREAVVACGVRPDDISWPSAGHPTVVERGLRMSPLLSANYLVALGDLEVHWRPVSDHGHGLAKPDPRMVDRAVIGIGRHGPLLADEAPEGRLPHEMLSTTALALFAYFGRHTVPTHVIRPEGELLPPQLVASVLTEAEQLREENAEVVSQATTIERASTLLGVCALGLVAALGWVSSWIGAQLEFPILALFGGVVGVVALALLGSAVLLSRMHLCPPWLQRLATLVDEGVPGLRERWRKRLPGGAAPPDAS
jgi:hypothetical protein